MSTSADFNKLIACRHSVCALGASFCKEPLALPGSIVPCKRDEYFKAAHLENVLSAAAGLLVLLVYSCKDELFEKYAEKPHVRPDFRVYGLDDSRVFSLLVKKRLKQWSPKSRVVFFLECLRTGRL